jgi:hypothetical protein
MANDTAGIVATRTGWYRSLTRVQRTTLAATYLGWLFDGFETGALILAVAPAAPRATGHEATSPPGRIAGGTGVIGYRA